MSPSDALLHDHADDLLEDHVDGQVGIVQRPIRCRKVHNSVATNLPHGRSEPCPALKELHIVNARVKVLIVLCFVLLKREATCDSIQELVDRRCAWTS